MLPRLSDFVHHFLQFGLLFATCKCNYVFFLKKSFSPFLFLSKAKISCFEKDFMAYKTELQYLHIASPKSGIPQFHIVNLQGLVFKSSFLCFNKILQ